MEVLPEKDDWNASEDVISHLEETEDEFSEKQKQRLEEGEIDVEEYARLLPQGYKVADEVMGAVAPENIEDSSEELELVDLGSGIGTYAAIAASIGIDSVGIEREPELHEKAEELAENVDSDSLPGDLEYIQGDFYHDATWEQLDKDLQDFSVVVAYLPGDQMDETLEFLRENGSEDAVYIFPELGGKRNVEGFEHSELNEHYGEELGQPIYEMSK